MATIGTDSYLELAAFKDWCASRGYDLANYTDPQIEASFVVSAVDYLDPTFEFKGEKLDANQAMGLPTDEVAIADITSGSAQAAWQQLNGFLFVPMTTQSANGSVSSESKSVASLSKSVTYEEGTARTNTFSTTLIKNLLKPYVKSGSGGFNSYRVL